MSGFRVAVVDAQAGDAGLIICEGRRRSFAAEIQELKSKLEASEVSQKLAVTEALSAVEKERDTLALAQAEREKKAASELAEALLAGELHKVSAAKEEESRRITC